MAIIRYINVVTTVVIMQEAKIFAVTVDELVLVLPVVVGMDVVLLMNE